MGGGLAQGNARNTASALLHHWGGYGWRRGCAGGEAGRGPWGRRRPVGEAPFAAIRFCYEAWTSLLDGGRGKLLGKALDMRYTCCVASVRLPRRQDTDLTSSRAQPAMTPNDNASPPHGWKCSGKDARVKVARSDLSERIIRSLGEASKALQEPKKRDRILVGTIPS